MDKTLKDIEFQLEDMYEKIRYINILKKGCDILREHIDSVNYNIKKLSNTAPSGISAVNYSSSKVQTSKGYHCSIEQRLIDTITEYEKKIMNLNEQIRENEDNIMLIEQNIMELRLNVEELDTDSKKFIEFKYKDKKGIYEIAQHFNIDENTAYRKRDSILKSILQRTYFKSEFCGTKLG